MNDPKSIFSASRDFSKRQSGASEQDNTSVPSSIDKGKEPSISISNGPNREASPARAVVASSSILVPTGKAEDEGVSVARAINQGRQFKVPQKFESFRPQSQYQFETAGQKRALQSRDSSPQNSSITKRKRARTDLCLTHSFDQSNFTAQPSSDPYTPPSPLFFSNSPTIRPPLPPRFSSSEAAAKMISKTQEEEGIVRTVTLPRGPLRITSPLDRTPTPGRKSADRSSRQFGSETPETSAGADPLKSLRQIGITELLEHDQRPTFVIDLGAAEKESPQALRIVYANPALHSIAGLYDFISGREFAETDSGNSSPISIEYTAFKAWALGDHQEEQLMDVKIPLIADQRVSWSASTLRRRIRIIAGHLLTLPPGHILSAKLTSATTSPPAASIASNPSVIAVPTPPTQVEATAVQEPFDYFTGVPIRADSLDSKEAEQDHKILPSIEKPINQNDVTRAQRPGGFSRTPSAVYIDAANGFASQDWMLTAASVGHVDAFPATDLFRGDGFFDWTRLPSSDDLPEHIKFARSLDWGATALGPIETWSADLRQMCNLIMASPHPAAMYWGEELVAIYNEAYVYLAGQKHPQLMGRRYKEAWPEIWDEVKDVFAGAQKTGQATMKDDDCLFIKRGDVELEETYFSWSIIPLVGGDGTVKGLYNPAFEKTRRKVAERRMLTLREVGERTAMARDQSGFWHQAVLALECNEFDTPFVLLYSLSDETDSDDSSMHSNSLNSQKQCFLEGSLGVPSGHEAAPDVVDLRTSNLGFLPYFREVLRTNKPRFLTTDKGELPRSLLDGLEWRGFGDPCRSVVVCPVHPTTSEESTLGFLVMGINPRRPYDDDYALFIQLLSRQLATSLASVVLFEKEIKRGQRAAKLAALDRIELSEQLAARTQEAIDSETKFTRMAEFAPVGMFITDSQGKMTFCNDSWYEISRVPRDVYRTEKWIECVFEPDQALVRQMWADLVTKTKSCNAEFRFKAPWTDQNGVVCQTWVLFSAYPEKNMEGTLKSIFGSITDISQQKWAEKFQKRKTEEAIELKRQQENFIDMTSHEMRNPLSAILQCSDEIIASLTEARSHEPSAVDQTIINENIDAAQTIALCAQHQKRIVDDVLTLSKLDSQLLMVTPVDVQPIAVVQRALKMFEGELQTKDILLKFNSHRTFKDLKIDWVRCDPSRVLQILINLITNSIKFTSAQKQKTITVTIAASMEPPTDGQTKVNYFPSRAKRAALSLGPEWGSGEEIYIHFSVEDTGQGLTKEEMKLLFMRFSQASPRTHVQYGGSGLGLFISRELAELQGGEIGVASQAGSGSIFAFYIKARRSSKPDGHTARLQEVASTRRTANTRSGSGKKASTDSPSKSAKSLAANQGILLVEDNMVNQTVLKRQLTHQGFTVYVANHGGEAIDRLKESKLWHEPPTSSSPLDISIILMDQEMPVMDGITCTRRIRELEQQSKLVQHVPIIGVTANARHEQISLAVEAGMDDVVCKPFRLPDLVPKMDELLIKYGSINNSSRSASEASKNEAT